MSESIYSLDLRLRQLERETAVLQAKIERDIDRLDVSIALQAKEYARRLEVLNHKAATIAGLQAKHLHQDIYDRDYREIRNILDELKQNRAFETGRQSVISAVVAIVVYFVMARIIG